MPVRVTCHVVCSVFQTCSREMKSRQAKVYMNAKFRYQHFYGTTEAMGGGYIAI